MTPHTKTWLALIVMIVGIFEFWTAMVIFGKRGSNKHAKLLLRLHRIGGYVFLVLFAWLMWVGLDMLRRHGGNPLYEFTARKFYHAFLAVAIFVLLLLKISFARVYRVYRPYIPLLGIIITAGTVVLWAIAGLMFLFMMGGVRPG